MKRRRIALAALCAGACLTMVELAPATVEEQRARLPPPPKECADDVEGTWKSLRYSSNYQPPEWYEVMIEVKRVAPGSTQLEATMLVRYWNGGPKDETPPNCKFGQYDRTVFQPSKGHLEGMKMFIDAQSWRMHEAHCGGAEWRRYNPDHYSGVIDPAIQEFQSVNNDGGRAVNEPSVFRRIKCPPPPEVDGRDKTPGVTVKPPSFIPTPRAGCSR